MTTVRLVCPQCRNQTEHEQWNVDTSKEISCAACGFTELPTAFELAEADEKKRWWYAKIMIIVLAGIAFSLVGLSVIVLAAFFVPIIIAAVIFLVLYRRWKEKKAMSRDN